MTETESGLMQDELFARQFRKFLRERRKEAIQNAHKNVNTDLESVEQAYENYHLYLIRRKTWGEELTRLALCLREVEHSCFEADAQIQTWKLTFESRLRLQQADAISRLSALSIRSSELAENADPEEGTKIQNEIAELKEKINRLQALSAYKNSIVTSLHVPKSPVPIPAAPAYFTKNICSNTRCGRAKSDITHPLCRNCQKLLKEGKADQIHGNWAGIELPLQDEGSVENAKLFGT